MKSSLPAIVLLGLANGAFAQDGTGIAASGDAAAGEAAFRQCQSCHHVVAPDGEVLAGRAAVRTGPNLFGVVGRVAGSEEEFRYSDLMEAAHEQGIVWDEASFTGYVQDPTGWLREATGENGRSKMTFRVRKEEAAVDIYAYLLSLAPPEADATD